MRRAQFRAAPLVLILLTVQLGFCWKALGPSLSGDVDFRAFYASGHLVAIGHGSHLYDYEAQRQVQNEVVGRSSRTLPFLYPAYAALPFIPLSFLPYRAAFVAFGITNLGLLWLAGFLIGPHLAYLSKGASWLPGLIALCFFPVSIAIMQGQISFMLLLLYTLCFVSLRKRQPFLAGLLLALTLMKFQIALPIALLFLLWRQTRVIQGFLLGASMVALISLAITGAHGAGEYQAGLAAMTRDTLSNPWRARQTYGMFAGDMPNLHGLFFFLTHGRSTGLAFTLIGSAIVMVWAARRQPSIAIALPASMLVSYHMQAYDLTLLLLPLALAFQSSGSPEEPDSMRHAKPPRAVYAAAAILVVPAAPFLLVHGLCSLFVFSVFTVFWAHSEKRLPQNSRNHELLSSV